MTEEQQSGKAKGAARIDYPPNARLERMRKLSRFLDNSILLPGGYRIGMDPLIGLVPAAGDLIAAGLSFWLIWDATPPIISSIDRSLRGFSAGE